MNERSFDQLLDAWIELGPSVAPNRVADAARLEASTTRQTAIPPWWPPRRFLEMNTMIRVGLVAAAVVAAALLGYNYFIAPNVGGPSLFPSEPTPTPRPTPESEPAALIRGSGALEPGAYEITQVPPLRITITVPDGWESLAVPGMVWGGTAEKAGVAFFTVTDLYADPCDPGRSFAGIGSTVDDLVQGLAGTEGIAIDAQADVTVSGYAGTRLEVSATELDCSTGADPLLLRSSSGAIDRPHPGGGDEMNRWYILDVEGQRLVIHAAVPESNPSDVAADVESILDSVTIEAP